MLTAPQNTEAGRYLRSIGSSAWRRLCRAERIACRESTKATEDAMIFGSGFVVYGDAGEPRRDGSDVCRHVPPWDVWIEMRARP